jgi:hypothetical protein
MERKMKTLEFRLQAARFDDPDQPPEVEFQKFQTGFGGKL